MTFYNVFLFPIVAWGVCIRTWCTLSVHQFSWNRFTKTSVEVPARCSSMLFGSACSGLKSTPPFVFVWCSVIHVGVLSCLLSSSHVWAMLNSKDKHDYSLMPYLHSNGKVTAVLRIYLTSNATANVKFGGCEALESLKTELSDGRLGEMLVNNTKTSYIGE